MSTGTNDPNKCQWCAGFHTGKCPLVKSMDFYADGTVRKVEFYAPNDYPQTAIVTGTNRVIASGSRGP